MYASGCSCGSSANEEEDKPCEVAFCEAAAFPASDFGPVECWALALLARTCAVVAMTIRAYTGGSENRGVRFLEIPAKSCGGRKLRIFSICKRAFRRSWFAIQLTRRGPGVPPASQGHASDRIGAMESAR